MYRPSWDLIEINYDRKEIIIRNNLPFYRAVKSGALLALFPLYDVLTSFKAAAESVDPALAQIIDTLYQVLTVAYLYHRPQWTTRFVRSLGLHGSASATLSANLSLE